MQSKVTAPNRDVQPSNISNSKSVGGCKTVGRTLSKRMSEILNVTEWRASTKREIACWLEIDPNHDKHRRHLLIVRTQLRPVDLYCYLVARFGTPNGIQNFLRRDDSDNWIHWDYNIKAGGADIYFAGTSRDIHIIVEDNFSDEQWKALILAIKRDYRRVGKLKSDVLRGLEKYVVFQNRYVSLARLCADLHAAIVDATLRKPIPKGTSAYENDGEDLKKEFEQIAERANAIFGDCLKLRLLTPIMAEAFINMTILILCKSTTRDDEATYQALVRAKIPHRLALLSKHCNGFARDIDTSTEAYANFLRVINKRNFALHGNVDPIREQIEVVYFEGKRPLFERPGHNIEKFFEHLEVMNKPQEVIKDYEDVHEFLVEIAGCLDCRTKYFFQQVIEDAYPGYEVRRRGVTRILPDHIVAGFFEGARYDDELEVDW